MMAVRIRTPFSLQTRDTLVLKGISLVPSISPVVIVVVVVVVVDDDDGESSGQR